MSSLFVADWGSFNYRFAYPKPHGQFIRAANSGEAGLHPLAVLNRPCPTIIPIDWASGK